MVMLKHHAIMQYLWVLEHLLQIENWTAGDVLLMEEADPVRGGPQVQSGVEDGSKRITMSSAQVRRGKAAVGPQVSQLESDTQTTKRRIRPGGDVNVPVLRLESPGWAEVMEMVAHRWDQHTALKEICGAGCEHTDEAIEKVRLNFLPPPGVLTMRQSEQNPTGREKPSDGICDGHPHAHRGAMAIARDAHQP
jgi:hypothetical protein